MGPLRHFWRFVSFFLRVGYVSFLEGGKSTLPLLSCCVRNATACRSVDLSWDKDGPDKISFAQLWQDRLFFGMLLHRVIQWVLETKKKSSIWIPATHHYPNRIVAIFKRVFHNIKSSQQTGSETWISPRSSMSFVAFWCLFLAKKPPSFSDAKDPAPACWWYLASNFLHW